MTSRIILAVLAFVLVGCGADPIRFAVPDVTSDERIRVAIRSVELREVSLPAYARSEEIWRETPDGALVSDSEVLWADDPSRGVTQELTRQLSALTGARVAAEPWPFRDPADARLEVRIDEMVAGADGKFRLSGQFLTASDSGNRDRSGMFKLWAPIEGKADARAIALARANAVKELARQIARTGL